MELSPVFKTIVFDNKEKKYFSLQETIKKYENQRFRVGKTSFPLRVTEVQKPAGTERPLYSNMQSILLFYYIDPKDENKIRIVKRVNLAIKQAEENGEIFIYRTI